MGHTHSKGRTSMTDKAHSAPPYDSLSSGISRPEKPVPQPAPIAKPVQPTLKSSYTGPHDHLFVDFLGEQHHIKVHPDEFLTWAEFKRAIGVKPQASIQVNYRRGEPYKTLTLVSEKDSIYRLQAELASQPKYSYEPSGRLFVDVSFYGYEPSSRKELLGNPILIDMRVYFFSGEGKPVYHVLSFPMTQSPSLSDVLVSCKAVLGLPSSEFYELYLLDTSPSGGLLGALKTRLHNESSWQRAGWEKACRTFLAGKEQGGWKVETFEVKKSSLPEYPNASEQQGAE